jgi:hypothetical protein
MTVSIKDLQEKIEKVKEDIGKSDDLKSRLVLTDYLEYLKDELRMLENANRAGTRPGK